MKRNISLCLLTSNCMPQETSTYPVCLWIISLMVIELPIMLHHFENVVAYFPTHFKYAIPLSSPLLVMWLPSISDLINIVIRLGYSLGQLSLLCNERITILICTFDPCIHSCVSCVRAQQKFWLQCFYQ